jgi:UDP-glucuronate 4-epimerase
MDLDHYKKNNLKLLVSNSCNAFLELPKVDIQETALEGIVRVIGKIDKKPPHSVYNIGCSKPVQLMDFIHTLEDAIGKKTNLEMYPMQQGDVYQTYADTTALMKTTGYKPETNLSKGIDRLVEWYRNHFVKI